MASNISSNIRAFANTDHVIVAWRFSDNIPNCIGFAVSKKLKGQPDSSAVLLNNYVGFESQSPKPGDHKPSNQWPIQRFVWTDHSVTPGQQVCYKAVPMLTGGTALTADTANDTGWSDPVTVGTGTDYEAYFNRGIISSQFMNRQMGAEHPAKGAKLADILNDESGDIPTFLGGILVKKLFSELDAVIADPSITLYSSLYELNDGGVIDRFKKIGSRLNLVLANGAFSTAKPDENEGVRADLKKTAVKVHDRIVSEGHFAHNKFMVFCKNDKPYKVWTGSTNLTQNGLYTQVNNAVIINDAKVAQWYLDEWNQIKNAGNAYPAGYVAYNTKGNPDENNMTTWFAPVSNEVDLKAARELIDNAEDGILFLFFNPGTHDTLYNEIVDNIGANGKNLFVHGVMNADPGGKKAPLVKLHKGETSTGFDTVLPKAITNDFAEWEKELTPKMVTIHSKVVIIDPFGNNPVVMTGSHNLGPKASAKNDDNLNIIKGNASLAQQYAVNILSVYDHYHWRYDLSVKNAGALNFKFLSTDPNWMKSYLAGPNEKELDFLFPAAKAAEVANEPLAAAINTTVSTPATTKTAGAPVKKAPDKKAAAKPAKKPAAKSPAKKTATKTPAKKAVKKAPAKKVAAKKVAAKKTAKKVAVKKAVAKKAPKKAAPKKVVKKVAKKAAVKKAAPKKVAKKPVKKAVAKKAAPKKVVKKAPVKKASAKKVAAKGKAKKVVAKKPAAKKKAKPAPKGKAKASRKK